MNEQQLRKEAAGKMPSLEEMCQAVLEARKKYAVKIRRARREAREQSRENESLPSL